MPVHVLAVLLTADISASCRELMPVHVLAVLLTADISASCRELMQRRVTGIIMSPPNAIFLCFQEEADTGDEIPDEDEEVVVSKENVVVTVPADFTLSESCQELMNQLAATIYRWGPRSQTSTVSAAWGGHQASVTRCISRACVSVIGYALSWAPVACPEGSRGALLSDASTLIRGLRGVMLRFVFIYPIIEPLQSLMHAD